MQRHTSIYIYKIKNRHISLCFYILASQSFAIMHHFLTGFYLEFSIYFMKIEHLVFSYFYFMGLSDIYSIYKVSLKNNTEGTGLGTSHPSVSSYSTVWGKCGEQMSVRHGNISHVPWRETIWWMSSINLKAHSHATHCGQLAHTVSS